MTADGRRASPLIPLHVAVPGRVRVRVPALRHDADAIQGFLKALLNDHVVITAHANPRTGSVLVRFAVEIPVDQMLERLVAVVGRKSVPTSDTTPCWHAMDAEAVVAAVESDGGQGLAEEDARRRLAQQGPNRLPIPRRRSAAAILAGQFTSLPVMLLAGSAIVSLVGGAALEAAAILAVVALNGVIGAGCEVQAERMIANLDRQRRRVAVVRRDGKLRTLDAESVVPGDLLVLAAGQFVPADARLIEGSGLTIDESVLTGESLPVAKDARTTVAAACPLADRTNMAWRGTLVAGGSALAAVVATGRDTEIGRIQTLVGNLDAPQTPLQHRMDLLGRTLVMGSLALCALMVVIGLARGLALPALLRSAVALAVAAIPEGLPTVATLSLAHAVGRLRRKGVLVRRLEAVETLGVVTVAFFDKTGTLTFNRMSVAEVAPHGDSTHLWQIATLCSDASVAGWPWRVEGSPTETALVMAALDHGIDVPALRAARPRLAERYRDERRQSMATLHDVGGGRRLLAVKGSPLEVLAACALSDPERAEVEARNHAMAASGLRVLGFAWAEGTEENLEDKPLRWLGLVGLADPLRPGASELLARLRADTVERVMLTGDQAATAVAVARSLGMVDADAPPVADAATVERLPPDQLMAVSRDTRLFARIQPGHKLKVVEAFRQGGHVVAMVGDGVNDAPALKAADIGITMGRKGSPAARDLSDLVLENDDLAGLAEAVEQGRLTHVNIRKSVHFLVATNLSEMVLMLATTALGAAGGLTPLQLLWINLVTDVVPGLALAREPAQSSELRRPGQAGALLGTRAGKRVAVDAAIMAAGALGAFTWGGGQAGGLRASTLATTSLVTGQLLYAFSGRSEGRFSGGPNPALSLAVGATLALHGAALAVPGLRTVLRFASLGLADLAVGALAGAGSYLLTEIRKPMT
ncbi:MAG: cation-transporting P-type ATPase [Magnetospirillum sp.]|nr:cation-transporting P-type ATPase [Magnetospirillum sp.]